ncbi:hypothetical protein D7B24_007234 [Verticillium nonalfalfae]|uniref:lytic cellulose monooxygenase (C4-dehydrogenating) n=1 Tax=Verticillium nonalfalfae TaxID=1051616 RepID=A0A3M9Y7C1_9PEZI|nr:uncharacterized protein D7B24_007234 [Verticillium nonalfalfae]RNJ56399.1 hypothetical protein D7B24_007234 [Verticillium nonalfalfae]
MVRVALLLFLTSQAAAHGYIKTFTLDGTDHEGFRNWNPDPSPSAIGWPFTTPDEGPELDPTSPDMICRRGATPAANHGTVTAGSTMLIHWTSADPVLSPEGWAHSGPTLTYLAPCHGSCAEVDKSTLRWTKIQESGLVSGPANAEGLWASDVLRANGGVMEAVVPPDIAPGNYVVRSEMIALHRSHLGEPEFYPQCGNVQVVGDGRDTLAGRGVSAQALYSRQDEQLYAYSLHEPTLETAWPLPGPKLYAGQGWNETVPGPVHTDNCHGRRLVTLTS